MTQLALALAPNEYDETRRRPRRRRVRLRVLPGGRQGELPLTSPLPATRGDCEPMREQHAACPFLSCRHHLWHARADRFEAMLDDPPDVWPTTCSLDAAELYDRHWRTTPDRRTPMALVGEQLGFSGERVRQIQNEALVKIRAQESTWELIADVEWFG